MYEQLKRIRELESSDPEIDRAELELFELVKSIGASSFQQILQQKSDTVEQRQRERALKGTNAQGAPPILPRWMVA